VIVPATNAPPSLAWCVAAIEPQLRPDDELHVVREPRDAGPAAARNAGARRAEGEVLVFVDADVVVAPDALERIRARLAVGAPVIAVFGAYDDDPAASDVVSRFRNLLHHHVHLAGAGPATTFWAGLGAVRREAFAAAGGFDAARFPAPSVEDVELGMRLHADGLAVLLDPEIRGKHLKRWTVRSMVATDVRRRGVPWILAQLRAGRLDGSLNLGWAHRLSALAAAGSVCAVLARRPRAAVLALAALPALQPRLYALLARRGGPRLVAAGLVLHALHLLSAAVSVPLALGVYAKQRVAGE
jgi:GT2 family glycosyltransferase